MKFVEVLEEEEIETLRALRDSKQPASIRKRAEGILLSDKGFPLKQIAFIMDVNVQTVSLWIESWEQEGIVGLLDKARPGRPKELTQEQEEEVLEEVKKEPRSLKKVAAELGKKFGIALKVSLLRKIIKQAGLSWKRVRKSLKSKRKEDNFEWMKGIIRDYLEKEQAREIEVKFFDQSGFDREPSIAYAWQEKGETIEVPSSKSNRLNVLGIMGIDSRLESIVVEGGVNSDMIIAYLDNYSLNLPKPTVLIMDNASMHKSYKFFENIPIWQERGLFIEFLPTYSPELNKIEILWRKIKYEWMPFNAYESLQSLRDALFHILKKVGETYIVNFS